MADEPSRDEASKDAVAETADERAGSATGAGPTTGTTPPPDPAAAGVNQGTTGNRPLGESPLSVESEKDAFAERPEVFVGGAFVGGLALALILRRLGP